MAFSALSFFLVIVVPVAGDDEAKISPNQTPESVHYR
jgi:hypothetical protein